MSWYLDSSAILKFIFAEPERPVLVKEISGGVISSELSRLEVRRAVFKMQPSAIELADEELAKINFADLSGTVLRMAGSFGENISLGSLDAIHVATTLLLGERIEGLITYDKQMAKNAKKMGINVLSPGAKL